MKRCILLLTFAAMCAGCEKKEGMMVFDYKIINLIELDIVVTLDGIENKRTIAIEPGQVRTLRTYLDMYKGERPAFMMSASILELLEPIMTIDGEIIPGAIWQSKYWLRSSSVNNDHGLDYYNTTYTLVMTNELLDEIKNLQ